jgi:hypothetical protein
VKIFTLVSSVLFRRSSDASTFYEKEFSVFPLLFSSRLETTLASSVVFSFESGNLLQSNLVYINYNPIDMTFAKTTLETSVEKEKIQRRTEGSTDSSQPDSYILKTEDVLKTTLKTSEDLPLLKTTLKTSEEDRPSSPTNGNEKGVLYVHYELILDNDTHSTGHTQWLNLKLHSFGVKFTRF